MREELYFRSLRELQQARDTIHRLIVEGDPEKDTCATHIITDERLPFLREIDEAIAILKKERRE